MLVEKCMLLLFIFLHNFALFWNRAHQPCPSQALLLTFWRAQSPSWPQRIWAARTRPGENSCRKVMSSMKAKLVTSSPMMVHALNIANNSFHLFLYQAYNLLIIFFFLPKKPSRTPGKTPAAPEQAMSWNALMTWWRVPWAEHTQAEKEPHLKVFLVC